MARITLRQLLDHAAEHGYGVPAFNINNMEQGLAIMEAAAAVDARADDAGKDALGRDAHPDTRREVPGDAVSGTRPAEPRAENAAETHGVEGAEHVQAEELRRRRERTDGDTPRSGI